MRNFCDRLPTKYITLGTNKFGITTIFILVICVHYISSSRYDDEEYKYDGDSAYVYDDDQYLDEGLHFQSNIQPLVNDHKDKQPVLVEAPPVPANEAPPADNVFYQTKDEDEGLHFVSSHPTKPAPSLKDNWQDSVDRPYFPQGQDKYFSFNEHEEKLEEMSTVSYILY